jgi:hypothetical protein
MKSTPSPPGNRFIGTGGGFDRLRFPAFVGMSALGFLIMLCIPATAQTSPVEPSAGTLSPMESVDSLVDEPRNIYHDAPHTFTRSTTYPIARQSFPSFGEYLVSLTFKVFTCAL